MPYLPTLNAFLHSASLLLAAYPTARITTKYSLPKSTTSQPSQQPQSSTTTTEHPSSSTAAQKQPAATLTAKIYHAASGICLKYSTDKAQEVGRLITSLGRLARGESLELPAAAFSGAAPGAGGDDVGGGDKMDVDSVGAVKVEDGVVTGKPVGAQQGQQGKQEQGQGQGQQGGGGGKKKKKGKR